MLLKLNIEKKNLGKWKLTFSKKLSLWKVNCKKIGNILTLQKRWGGGGCNDFWPCLSPALWRRRSPAWRQYPRRELWRRRGSRGRTPHSSCITQVLPTPHHLAKLGQTIRTFLLVSTRCIEMAGGRATRHIIRGGQVRLISKASVCKRLQT